MVSYRVIGDITPEVQQVIYDKYGLPRELLIRRAVILADSRGSFYISITYELDDGISDMTQQMVDSIGNTLMLIAEFLTGVYNGYKEAKARGLKK